MIIGRRQKKYSSHTASYVASQRMHTGGTLGLHPEIKLSIFLKLRQTFERIAGQLKKLATNWKTLQIFNVVRRLF